ncbi:MAG: bacterial Ig-like domain-containing protein [Firmicutes bacterium]|nr:bacterial Ig-like domain-containing protein [Bacillota bacterium]
MTRLFKALSICFCFAIGVAVFSACETPPELSRIDIKTAPMTQYFIGEDISVAGGVLEATFVDGSKADVPLTANMLNTTQVNKDAAGTYQIVITYTLNNKPAQTSFNVTYSPIVPLVSVAITQPFPVVEDYIVTYDFLEAVVSPAGANVSLQWQEWHATNGWQDIAGANSKQLMPVYQFATKVRVVATALRGNSGHVTSSETDIIHRIPNSLPAPVADPAAPPTTDTITLTEIWNAEYAICWYAEVGNPNGTEPVELVWQASNVFDGLQADTRYKFVVRLIAGTYEIHVDTVLQQSLVIRTLAL